MASLNYLPSKIMRKYDVSSCTDVTGFGLMGHALECTNDLYHLVLLAMMYLLLKKQLI
jgi:selenide,water dikinase